MKRLAFGLMAALVMPFASAQVAALEDSQETVKVWRVDSKGKPPFKRTLVEVSVADVARLESMGEIRTEKVRVVDFRGKPPFRRVTREMQVVETAALEAVDAPVRKVAKPRPFLKRHR